MIRSTMLFGAVCACSFPLVAQQPNLKISPEGISIRSSSGSVSYTAIARPASGFVLFADTQPGSHLLLGQHLRLGLSPLLTLIDSGTMPASGRLQGSLAMPVTTAHLSQALYFQYMSLAPSMPNGLFKASNGASVVVYDAPSAITLNFENAHLSFSGNYARVPHRLEGKAPRTRVHSTVDPAGVPLLSSIGNPLNSFGSRMQMVFRPQDLGATGDPEHLTAIRWRPFFGQVQSETLEQFQLLVAHSQVTPDYSVGAFSALPSFPLSGLDKLFAKNYSPGTSPVSVWNARYNIRPGALRPDGYLPYPMNGEVDYNGVDSLLIEVKTSPNKFPSPAINGQFGNLMILSSPMPAARNHESGNRSNNGLVIDPSKVTNGTGDNFMYDYQLVFVRDQSTATSPVLVPPGGAQSFDYQKPILAADIPPGTRADFEYRGLGQAGFTAWSSTVDIADGLPGIQFRVTFTANRRTGAVPSIDTMVIPVR